MLRREYRVLVRMVVCSVALSSATFATRELAAESLTDSDKEQICVNITTLFRSARAVISKNQALINDASQGDKGLNGAAVVQAARANFKKATGEDLLESDSAQDGSLGEQARAALMAAISEVMDEN